MKLIMGVIFVGLCVQVHANERSGDLRTAAHKTTLDYVAAVGSGLVLGAIAKKITLVPLRAYAHRLPVLRVLSKQKDICSEGNVLLFANRDQWSQGECVPLAELLQGTAGVAGERACLYAVMSPQVLTSAKDFFLTIDALKAPHKKTEDINAWRDQVPSYHAYQLALQSHLESEVHPRVTRMQKNADLYRKELTDDLHKKTLSAARIIGLLTGGCVAASVLSGSDDNIQK